MRSVEHLTWVLETSAVRCNWSIEDRVCNFDYCPWNKMKPDLQTHQTKLINTGHTNHHKTLTDLSATSFIHSFWREQLGQKHSQETQTGTQILSRTSCERQLGNLEMQLHHIRACGPENETWRLINVWSPAKVLKTQACQNWETQEMDGMRWCWHQAMSNRSSPFTTEAHWQTTVV